GLQNAEPGRYLAIAAAGGGVDSLSKARLQGLSGSSSMRSLLSRAIQIDPSFHLGLTLVVLLAAAEIFAVILHYASRSGAGRITTLQTLPAALPRAPATAVAQPRPSQPATVATPLPSLAEQLMREGVQLRDRGDTTTALQRFDEALDSEPDNVGVLLEKAKTYDAMQLYDR